MRNFIRGLMPVFLLNTYRNIQKKRKEKHLLLSEKKGLILTKYQISNELKSIGIQQGDVLLVHSSLSRLGFVENGPRTVVEALLDVVGDHGHVLMPTSPIAGLQKEYIRHSNVFDVLNTPSKLGAISECFRTYKGVVRSAHPTEPVSVSGPRAIYFTNDHFGNLTPYNKNSPYYKVASQNGKILYLGVTLDNAGTSLHLLEDAITNFMFQVYDSEIFEVKVKLEDGSEKMMKTKVHNPEQSKKRRCDELIPLFERKGILKKVKIGKANSLLVDAKGMLDVMVDEYHKNGVTMYTPYGSKK